MTPPLEITFTPQRALLSVSDKRGIVELAKILIERGLELVATGNTAVLLSQHQLPVTEVSTCTHFPEMLDGRVKTLHPAIHAGILARDTEADRQSLAAHQIKHFDLIIVNLYPFEQIIADHTCEFAEAIENIDIGGPAMIRSAAKNHAHVAVVVNPDDYELLKSYVQAQKAPSNWQFNLAKKAFAHTAAYDAAIANYLNTLNDEQKPSDFPAIFTCQFMKQYELRYGENPHQQAIFYKDKKAFVNSLAAAKLIQGKQLSYNNLLDADAALNCVRSFPKEHPTCAIIKHGNPCGIAVADTTLLAYLRAQQTDPVSAYGGILAFNRALDANTVQAILEKQFLEVLLAPAVDENALSILASKPAIRVLITGDTPPGDLFKLDMRSIDGGLLMQEHDNFPVIPDEFITVTHKKPSAEQQDDLLFAWLAVKQVKSNAIVFAKDQATIGIGPGQTSRVMSTRIALWQAQEAGFSTENAVMASDAFIPFTDSMDIANQAGISAIIQPGGSIRDQAMIDAANAAGLIMVFTGYRHFRH